MDGIDPEDAIWSLLEGLRTTDVPSGSGGCGSGSGCPACGCLETISEDGQEICRKCSVVYSRLIDSSAEWRYYGNEGGADPARCGMPTNDLLPKSSMTSVIGGKYGSKDVQRMRMYQMWNSMPHNERSLYHVFDLITTNATKYGITSKILDDAKVFYKKASEKRISRGDKKDGLIASCIYYACLVNKVPRTPKEVARMFNIDTITLTKGNSILSSLLQLNVDSTGPEDFIARFGSKLNMNYDDIQKCKELARQLDALDIVSESAPTSVAAGCLYYYCLALSLDINKKKIADACEVCEGTITKCYKRLNQYRATVEAIRSQLR